MSEVQITCADVERLVPNLRAVGVQDDKAPGGFKLLGYEFTGGIYSGVVYTYSQIRFNVVHTDTGEPADISPEEMVPGDARYSLSVGFEYLVFQNPEEKDTDSESFKSYIGNILTTIIGASTNG